MEEETSQERQQNELEVLKAIFADQFVNRNEGNSTWKPLDIILTVVPQRENSGPLEIHAQLDLHVVACEEYPNKVPKIMIEKSKGLSDKQISEILTKLEDLAKALLGEVMIFEFVSYIQTVLTECNKPSFQSFYEEMLCRQKEQKKKEVELQKTEEDMKRQLIELEVEGIKKERQKNKTKKSLEISTSCDNEADNVTKKSILGCPAEITAHGRNNELKNNEICHGSDESFTSSISHFNLNSRLVIEFEILNFIGRGAFGDVLKVRNKLDDCLYAIKRIPLNLKNRQINKKITREVKLLSRLNHENIVRYYNSWLENSESQSEDVPVHQVDSFEKKANFPLEKNMIKSLTDNLNLSFSHPGSDPSFSDDDDDDDDDDDEDNNWIEFIEQNVEVDGSVGDNSTYHVNSDSDHINIDQYMYIQMEFCEKSTLRNAIDDNLYVDENRVWRLLKEVVEGLAYIHEQGIIHRDLKPVNIFIDCNDHVKIGDFGLATPNKSIATKAATTHSLISDTNNSILRGDTNATLTGQVGTALYTAPELNSSASNVHYNQKVDIYSLGIIFFEMCYPPLQTQMERFKILNNLRKSSRDFPTDFLDFKWCRQIRLIRDLLNHNPTERPSANEILKKDYIPLTELEDEKIHETIRHTLCNPQSKMYKHLISECFNQKVSAAEDITFNVSSHTKTAWQHAFVEKMADHARKIFRLHGGTCFSTPLLTPNNGVGISDTTAVSLMTRFGNIVNAPYDLRLSFARYLAQNPHITHMKRYTLDRVLRERRMLGVHPKETFECTFDIISPDSSNLAMEAEVLSIVCEILDSFSDCPQKNYIIRLNHVSLVTAILYNHQVVSKKHQTVCNYLSKLKAGYASTKMNSINKISQGISDVNIMNIVNAMNVEVQPGKFSSHFSHLLKKNTASSGACRNALIQLENLIQLLISLKTKCPIVIAPNVITNYNHYSGIMFQVVWEHKNKNNFERDIIAAGGRYDNLILQYKNALNVTKETKQSAVGVTIFLDRLGNALQPEYQHFPTVEVLVCSVGSNHLTEEKLKLVKELWTAEIRSTILNVEQSLEETQEYCSKMKIPYILYLKEAEPGLFRLRSWTREKLHEKKLTLSELVPYLKRVIKSNWNNVESAANTTHHHSRSESRSASVSINETHNINISFLTEEKLSATNKRRYENQASNCISNHLHKISTKMKIELIILNTPYDVLTAIVSTVDFNSKSTDYLASLIKKYPRYKKCLNRVGEYIEKLQTLEHIPVIVFYSIEDNNCKILI